MEHCLAIDVGASSGRHILGHGITANATGFPVYAGPVEDAATGGPYGGKFDSLQTARDAV